jgi:hypothetical protein
MNLAVSQNVKGYRAISGMSLPVEPYLDEAEAPKLSSFVQPLSAQKQFTFRSKVTIEGSSVFIPEQNFSLRFSPSQVEIESRPVNSWPKISIYLTADAAGSYQVKDLKIIPSTNTSEAEIKFTRFNWAVVKYSNFSFAPPKVGNIWFRFGRVSEEEITDLINRAKLFRKLKYLEYVFGRTFPLSDYIHAADVKNIDYIYRGLTEGEFVVRGDGLNLAIAEENIDWLAPPFSDIGAFPQSSKWYSDYFGDTVYLFNRKLEIGTVSVRLEKAVYSGKVNVPLSQHKTQQAVGIRFDVLDHQIYFRFDAYADKGKSKLQEKLARFKYQFLRDDPTELSNLIDEPLIRDVSQEEANWIAFGWLQYNYFPDRYCSQTPEFDEANKIWRVPIHLVYASGEGGEVGALQIDLKTGKVIAHTPIDTIRAKGKILAEKLMHARETAPVFAGD